MNKIYGDNSLRLRAQKLAAREKCGVQWSTGWGTIWNHVCVKIPKHAGKDHRCQCGTWLRKKKA